MYQINKGKDYLTEKFAVHKGHVVIVPSWPMIAQAVIMTLSIENGMNVVGKFLFETASKQDSINQVTLRFDQIPFRNWQSYYKIQQKRLALKR